MSTDWLADVPRLESDVVIRCENAACTTKAVYIVRIHPIDHCNVPRLDVRGDRVFTFCELCVASVAIRIGLIITEAKGISVRCKTCGRHCEKLHDVYAVESLVRR